MSPACSLPAPGSGGSGFASPQGGSTGSTETLRQVEPTWDQDPYHGTIPQKINIQGQYVHTMSPCAEQAYFPGHSFRSSGINMSLKNTCTSELASLCKRTLNLNAKILQPNPLGLAC